MKVLAVLFFFMAVGGETRAASTSTVTIASKIFTESYVLGEVAAQALEDDPGVSVNRKLGMGSTGILYESLRSGAIDVYPDYTGTLTEAILKRPELKSEGEIEAALRDLGLVISRPLGFNNTYAVAVKETYAEAHGLRTIGDLARVKGSARGAFSYEFIDRADGFRGMNQAYGLPFEANDVRRMEHSLAYQALGEGSVDAIDVYSTDAKIEKMHLRVLADDRNYFPAYQAVWVARRAFTEAHPELWKKLTRFEGTINEQRMRELNASVDVEHRSLGSVASEFLGRKATAERGRAREIGQRTLEHLELVAVSLLFSFFVGVPLGILAVRYRFAGQSILLASVLVQTIPSLALLCFLIPAFGVGTKPALAALCLYSLLPVVLNTYTGIRSIDPRHLENARAFGLSPAQALFRIMLPIASPTILAGVKTATIVSIGTATLAALVGAGGYGVPIVSGLSLNDIPTILTGAIPAAGLALFAYGGFEFLARIVIPVGLRSPRGH